jgi:translocation protein SEC62
MSAAKMESKQASKEANDAANDPARALAYVLRGNKGPEARSARLEYSRVDYFRGKDLYRALKARPEIIDEYAPKLTGVPTPTAPTEKDRNKQITAMGQELLKRGYFVKCDRVYKTPRPGRTKRVKFPKFLHQVPRTAQTFTEDGEGFYSWTYDQPMSWTFVIISFLVAFAVILMCLFPLSPIWFKKLILYFCLAILGLFFVIGVVRVFVFAVVWIVFGRQFWVLPNITSDEIPIDEVFTPMWAFDDLDAGGNVVGKIPALNRLAAAGTAAALLAALYTIAPEKGSAIKSINRAHGSILDLFDLYDTPKGLTGGLGENATEGANATAAEGAAAAANSGAAAGGEAAGADAGVADGWDPLDEDVAPPAPPPPYDGPEDAGAGDAETKAEL